MSTTNKDPFTFAQHLKGVRLKDILDFTLLGLTFLPGTIWGLLRPNIWVISEYRDDARDNGYWLFRHIRTKHPEQKVFYPIRKSSSDYSNVANLGGVIEFSGIKHYLLFWAASTYIGTTKLDGFPGILACDYLHLHNLTHFKYVFLNHGVARGYSPIVDGNRTNYALVIAISESEKDTIVSINHQPESIVKAVGFCRHDNLDNKILQKNLIVFMPTWRTWLGPTYINSEKDLPPLRKSFLASDYFNRCQELISNPDLIKFLEENNLEFTFYLHKFAQIFADCFTSESDRVTIAHQENYLVQDLLKRAAFLITDYSSVIFDYAYMKKPCCYYQFDAERFAKEQYAESEYFEYKRDGFGPVFSSAEEVVRELKRAYARHFSMDEKYVRRVKSYFPSFGKNHCEQTYQLIRHL